MRSGATLLVMAVLGIGSVCPPREARALGPVDLEIAGKVGAGTNPFGNGFPNPLGFGIGARAGVSLLGFYGGLGLMYYFGSGGSDVPGAGGAVSAKSFLYGIEGGYGSKLGPLTLRGQLGLGSFTLSQSGTRSNTNSTLYLEPGVTALLTFGTLLLGADANLLILPGISDPINNVNGQSSWDAAFTVHVQAGAKF